MAGNECVVGTDVERKSEVTTRKRARSTFGKSVQTKDEQRSQNEEIESGKQKPLVDQNKFMKLV